MLINDVTVWEGTIRVINDLTLLYRRFLDLYIALQLYTSCETTVSRARHDYKTDSLYFGVLAYNEKQYFFSILLKKK